MVTSTPAFASRLVTARPPNPAPMTTALVIAPGGCAPARCARSSWHPLTVGTPVHGPGMRTLRPALDERAAAAARLPRPAEHGEPVTRRAPRTLAGHMASQLARRR